MCGKMDVLWASGWIIFLISAAALPEIPSKGKQTKVLDSQSSSSEDISMPRFAEPIPNVTVSIGRDALLACVVENLKGYKVAWVRVDTQTILSIHHNVITQNNRISLTYNDHRSWYLHIKEVEENDRGWYMCQVNTDPMRSRKGYLQVVVPPLIVEGMTSNDMVVREGTNVTLMCKARGYPEPYVMWRREDGEEMSIGGENVNVVDGEILHITKVSRLHMAAYLCVASNGVPPSISKRVHLRVQFPPMLSIPNQLEGAYVGQDVTLECHTEAYPASINYWTTERGDMIISDTSRAGDKYETTSSIHAYSKYMKLKIRNVGANDFGSYRCVAKNSLGETDGVIKLDEILAPTTAVMSEITMYNRTLDGKRPNRNKFDTNALPDYGVEEWKDGGGGGGGDNGQPPIRNPPGAFHNSAVSLGFGFDFGFGGELRRIRERLRGRAKGRASLIVETIIYWIKSKSPLFHYNLHLLRSSSSTTSASPSKTNSCCWRLLDSGMGLGMGMGMSTTTLYEQPDDYIPLLQSHEFDIDIRSRMTHKDSEESFTIKQSTAAKSRLRRRHRDRDRERLVDDNDDILATIIVSPISWGIFIIFSFNLISIQLWRRICLPGCAVTMMKMEETQTRTSKPTTTRTTIMSPSLNRIKR
ncbi:neural cell adhesion molecule 1 [Eupeodes corollae]|uniref:neural cell adhesion molecule 1 n=1 Tax=Eupeodes corollae TaxID=290404 RepID=UPI002492293D|nr:neural cell adhesion molecule 1 [Eupeodes corollae]